jgi:hypothetical protein
MTLASDGKPDSDKLSPISQKMLELREAVLTEWGKKSPH